MAYVFTLKLPEFLLARLEETAAKEGRSKGALVREAIELLLRKERSVEDQIRRVTRLLMQGRKPRVPVDWEEIRREAAVPTSLSPEEEIRRSRRRNL